MFQITISGKLYLLEDVQQKLTSIYIPWPSCKQNRQLHHKRKKSTESATKIEGQILSSIHSWWVLDVVLQQKETCWHTVLLFFSPGKRKTNVLDRGLDTAAKFRHNREDIHEASGKGCAHTFQKCSFILKYLCRADLRV